MNEEFQKIYNILNEYGFMDNSRYKNLIDAIYAAHDIDTLITVLNEMDKECNAVEDMNLLEALDFIGQQYPDKKEVVDFLKIKKQIGSHLNLWDVKDTIANASTLDEFIDAVAENSSDSYVLNNQKESKLFCEIIENYPEKWDKCLPILLKRLPTLYEPTSLYEGDVEQRPSSEKRVRVHRRRRHYKEGTSRIVKSVLKIDPQKFAYCLPALQGAADEGDYTSRRHVVEISKQFMLSHPSECAELLVTCIDKYIYGNEEKEFANNAIEALELLIASKIKLDQEMQLKLANNIDKVSYHIINRNYDDCDDLDNCDDEKIWQEKRDEIYLKIMRSEAFSEETKTSILDKVDSRKKEFFAQVLNEKLCTPTLIVKILTKLKESRDYDEIEKITEQNYAGNAEINSVIETIKKERRNKKIINDVLNEYPAGKKVEALIRLADAVIKTKDDNKINQFKEMLFSEGEQYVFHIDRKAMDWFVNNGNPEDLEALNNLSQLYGIRTDLSEYWTVDPAQNAAYRIRFDGGYSEIGAVQYDGDMDEEISNPHYYRMLSEVYQKFKPDYSRDFKPSEYNLHENKAFQTLVHKGVKMPIKMLQAAFVEIHMPPEIAKELNATDLQHLLVNYVHHKKGWEHNSNYDMESSKILAERIREERRGDRIDMQDVSSKAPASIREKLWKKYAHNIQLVKFVSDDWERMGVSYDIIEDTWENAKEIGAPVKYHNGKASHYGMRNALHHALALRVGGTNDQSIVITNNIQATGEEDKWSSSDGDYYTVSRDGGDFYINSHNPFHLYDNPCVYLYLKASDGRLSVRKTIDRRMKKRMMITRIPSAKLNDGDRIVYYGGPRECSCAIMDKDGNIRQASYDFWKDNPTKDRQQTNVVAKKVKIRHGNKTRM